MQPVLSICIPTYNGNSRVRDNVREILTYEGNEIEVVACDNASTDDTQKYLNEICDSRFYYHRNEVKLDANKNFMTSLSYGHGEFLFLLMDRDRIDMKNIAQLIDSLKKENELSAVKGICGMESEEFGNFKGEIRKYQNGSLEAMRCAYQETGHPSGIMIRNCVVKDKLLPLAIERASDYHYIHCFLFAEAAVNGGCGIYPDRTVILPGIDYYTENRSRFCETSEGATQKKSLYFEPSERIKQMNQAIQHVHTLEIKKNVKRMITLNTFKDCLKAIVGYKLMKQTDPIWQHYGNRYYKVKEISLRELRNDAYQACLGVIRDLGYNDSLNKEITQIYKSSFFWLPAIWLRGELVKVRWLKTLYRKIKYCTRKKSSQVRVSGREQYEK